MLAPFLIACFFYLCYEIVAYHSAVVKLMYVQRSIKRVKDATDVEADKFFLIFYFISYLFLEFLH